MRPYETLVVLSNQLGAEQSTLVERCAEIIKAQGGAVDASHDWGSRKLAYPIAKQVDGHYYLIEYQAPPEAVSELERNLRISDGVLRYMSVQQEHTGLPPEKPVDTHRDDRDRPMHEMRSYDRGHRSSGPRDDASPRASRAESPAPAAPEAVAEAPKPAEPVAPEAAAADSGEGVKTDE
jgi:small subunit ribosomal protein S6